MTKNPILLRAGGALSVLALVGAAATWLKLRRSSPKPDTGSSSQPLLQEPAAGEPATDPLARLQAAEDTAPSAAGGAPGEPDSTPGTAGAPAGTATPDASVRPGLIPNPADKPLARGPEGDLSSGSARPASPAPESPTSEATAPAEPPSPASEPASEPSGEAGSAPGAEWQCQCGQPYRVTGEGRHRMFWLPDAAPSDPVLDDRCPNCGRELSLQD